LQSRYTYISMDEVVKHIFVFLGRVITPFAIVVSAFSPQPLQSTFLPSSTPTPTVTNTPTPTPSLTPTPTPTPTPIPKPTATPTPLPTVALAKVGTPTPTPRPTPYPVTSSQLDEWFTNSSNHYSIDRNKLWAVAVCESNLKPNAVNGPYAGLFQFSASTWISTRQKMGMDTNPDLRFNPEEAIRTAAFKISTDGLGPWPNCGKK
jgi:hypothetical protein